jgi:2-oxo-4-hydroxy-4-carboxy-5-ureidoimidazoline decarboxylase
VTSLEVRDYVAGDREWAAQLVAHHSGDVTSIARLGEMLEPLELPGIVAERDGTPVGLATVLETPERGMEVVALFVAERGNGAGTLLLDTVRQVAVASGHRRLWLVTTNDNLEALHFYLRRGMHVVQVHAGAVEADRALKSQIPTHNAENGLPIRDLVELELPIDPKADRLPNVAFPAIDDLDLLPVEAFVREVTPLFEGAPRFLARLAAERPFGSDQAMIDAAFEVARGLPDAERLELVEAHPRIGAPPASVSAASYAEQGYAEESPDDPDLARAYEELAMLNEVYERHFGFRYVIFVAGRPKTEIVPLLEHALRNEREPELRRAVDETVYIAADRLAALRA